MKIVLAVITPSGRRLRGEPEFALTQGYLERASVYQSCSWESFADEPALLSAAQRASGRTATTLVLFDGRGRELTSREWASRLGDFRDLGRQQVMIAIGPASGWSETALARAELTVSLGRMTLPHALAQVVVAEQIYRALTILAGHPYHCGH